MNDSNKPNKELDQLVHDLAAYIYSEGLVDWSYSEDVVDLGQDSPDEAYEAYTVKTIEIEDIEFMFFTNEKHKEMVCDEIEKMIRADEDEMRNV